MNVHAGFYSHGNGLKAAPKGLNTGRHRSTQMMSASPTEVFSPDTYCSKLCEKKRSNCVEAATANHVQFKNGHKVQTPNVLNGRSFPQQKTRQKIDDERYTHMINNGNVKNEMEQFCNFFQYDNNNSFLCNDYCEYMNSFFASEAQMYFGAKYHFDSFDKFSNLPVLTQIWKLSNFKKIKREYFANGEKNRYGKNALFKKIIKNHLNSVEKYTRTLATPPKAEFAQFRKRGRRGRRGRRGENGFPFKSKSVLRKYFNIGGGNSRAGKNSQKRGNVLKPNHSDGQKQSIRRIPKEKKILLRNPQMSRDEKGKFLKRIHLHFSSCGSSGIDILLSPDGTKGVSELFLLRKRQTDQLEENRDDKSTKSEGVHRHSQFVPPNQWVQIVSYGDMELYKLMRKRLRDKCKNEARFSTTSRWRSTFCAKKKAMKVLYRSGSFTGGKTDDKREEDQTEGQEYTRLSPKHVQTHRERNNAAKNGNGQLVVNLGRVKYKCLNEYHSLLNYQNGFTHNRGENNETEMEKPHRAGSAGGTTKWCSCSESDASFSNLQKSCGMYFSEEGTPNGMNASHMGHPNGIDPLYVGVTDGKEGGKEHRNEHWKEHRNEHWTEHTNKFYITSGTTCTSASKSEANPIDDLCSDERKAGSVSSEQFKKTHQEGDRGNSSMEDRSTQNSSTQNSSMEKRYSDHAKDIQEGGTHFSVKNVARPLPLGEPEQGGMCSQSKWSEKAPQLHLRHAQVEEDKLSIYHNERLCAVGRDYQRGWGSNLGDRRGGSPHGRVLSPRGARVHHPERGYLSIAHSQCNSYPRGPPLEKSLKGEDNKMENTPREGSGTLGGKASSDPFDQATRSCERGVIGGGTNPILLETPQLENKQKFALKPKVYWSKRRPFWEEKPPKRGIAKNRQEGMRSGTNTDERHCGEGSLKNVEEDHVHSEKNIITLNEGIHIGFVFTEGEKQPLRNFSLTSDSTCTLRSTPLHKRTLTNELPSPRERRIIRSSGNAQKRSYTTSCINETPIFRCRKNLSANIVSLVDANKYDSMRSRSGHSCAASSRESSSRLSFSRARVGRPRRGERGRRGMKTSHSSDGNSLKGDLPPPTLVENDPPMVNISSISNEISSNRFESKTQLKSIYTKRLVDKKEEPFTHTKETTAWGKQRGMLPPVKDNSLSENRLTRCAPPSGFLPPGRDSTAEELPLSRKRVKNGGSKGSKMNRSDKSDTPFTCTPEQRDAHKQEDPQVDCPHTKDPLPRERKSKMQSCLSDKEVVNRNLSSGSHSTDKRRPKKGRSKLETNNTTAGKGNQQITHFNSADIRNTKGEALWGNHLKWDCFTHSVCPNEETSKATEKDFSPSEQTHLGDPPRNGILQLEGNCKMRRLPDSQRGGSRNGVAISVGGLNGKSQLGKPREGDSPLRDHKECYRYDDGGLDYLRKGDHPSSRKRCIRLADWEQVNKRTQCVEGGTGGEQKGERYNQQGGLTCVGQQKGGSYDQQRGLKSVGQQKGGSYDQQGGLTCVGQQKGGSYNQQGRLKLGPNSPSGTCPKKIEAINKSAHHLGGDLYKDNLTSRANLPIDFFTKDGSAATGRRNLPPPLQIQQLEYVPSNVGNCGGVPNPHDEHCDGGLAHRFKNAPPEDLKKSTNETFQKKSQNSYLIEWYPGFDIPIGTYGRAILRKALHQKRMTDVKKCDELLSSNGLFPTSRSTFGDMKIRDLYRAAHILGVWNVAEKYCLLACERNGYKREWIAMLKSSGVKVTIKALKELRSRHLLTSKHFSTSGKKKQISSNSSSNNNRAKKRDPGGVDTNGAVKATFERGAHPGGPMLEAPSPIRKKSSHSPNCSHDGKAGTTPSDCLHSKKCKRENKTCYTVAEQQSYLSTGESKMADAKRTPNQVSCSSPRNNLPSEHINEWRDALLRRLKKNQMGITNDGSCQIGSGRDAKTDFVKKHKDKLSPPPQMSNAPVVAYTAASNYVSADTRSNSLSKIPFGYSTQDRFSNVVGGPLSGTLTDDPEMSDEIGVENSNQLQNTCHFFDANFLHARGAPTHQNWNSTGTASMGDADHIGGITIRGDTSHPAGNIPVMGDLSTYDGTRNEHALEMGMLSDLFHTGGTADSFQFWGSSKSGSRFVDEYM
ncbi:hypothetical protein, conserved [Plasmodium vivax]|uniref:Uncharacterized protein n=1 Tax=Plasmodium vivax TaxID=5855 RepID=A0A1G4H1U4_PLAVI|nr:hypothetical protein, conserved [Plasmodium vivax]